jgi:predicted DNA-binding transcriptional regulator AlpA
MRTEENHGPRAGYSINEFCQDYGYGRSTAYRAIAEGRLVARKAGGRTILLASDIAAWRDSLPAIEPKASA